MRVAIVVGELCPVPPIRGGAVEQLVSEAAAALRRYVDALHIICPSDPELPCYEESGSIRYHRVAFPSHLGWRYMWRKDRPLSYATHVAGLLRTINPDVVHVHNRPLAVNVFRRALGSNVRIVLHAHNIMEYLGKRERPSYGFAPKCDLYVACSGFLLASEGHKYDLSGVPQAVIYNGVDTARFSPVWERTAERNRLRAQYGISADEKVILFCGKIRETKGVHCLLKAMEVVHRSYPSVVLVLVGGTRFGLGQIDTDTDFSRLVKQEISTSGVKTVMAGFIPPERMPDMYLLGDLFVGPSTCEEAFGLVHLEAQACGLPVVGTTRGGIPEVVQDGASGYLVDDPCNPHTLAAPIVRLLGDVGLRSEMGRAGRARAMSTFGWDRITVDTVRLYEDMCAARPVSGGASATC